MVEIEGFKKYQAGIKFQGNQTFRNISGNRHLGQKLAEDCCDPTNSTTPPDQPLRRATTRLRMSNMGHNGREVVSAGDTLNVKSRI